MSHRSLIASIIVIAFLIFQPIYTQQEDIEMVEDPQINQYNQQQQQNARRQQQFSMKRTACLVLARYHSNTQKQMIESIMGSLPPEDQNKYINKLYATAIEHCLPIISIDQAQQFFIENPSFNPAQLFYIYDGFDYGEVANDIDTLSADQKAIIKFIKQFDEQMAVKKQERQAQEQDSGYNTDDQITIFWIPVKGWESMAQMTYLLVFLIIVGVALFWGFSNLQNSTQAQKNKKKKNKKA